MPSEPYGRGSAVAPPEFYINQAAQAGVPQAFMEGFLAANPGDFHRILEVWQPEATPEQQAVSAQLALPSQKQIVGAPTNGSTSSKRGLDLVSRVAGDVALMDKGAGKVQQAGRSAESIRKGMVGRLRQVGPSSRAVSARTRLVAATRGNTNRPRNLDAVAVASGLTAGSQSAAIRARLRRPF
jgi:hypothetical protein